MKTILDIQKLSVSFRTDDGLLQAVNNISFTLNQGEVLGIVGESGSGKTVTGMSIMRLLQQSEGSSIKGKIVFEGTDLLKLSEKNMQNIRGNKIAMIFQDPMTSLNPFLRVSTQIMEVLVRHKHMSKRKAHQEAVRLLKMVSIPQPERRVDNYPHQFSGGMRQRIVIAMAISCKPHILIADEPTTALDVTIQAQVLDIIKELKDKINTAVILITHDLGVVAGLCDRVHVMYAGRMMEKGTVHQIFSDPKHPYTQGLLHSLPRIDQNKDELLSSIPGQAPNLITLSGGCPFFPRCTERMDICLNTYPGSRAPSQNREVQCWKYEKQETNNV